MTTLSHTSKPLTTALAASLTLAHAPSSKLASPKSTPATKWPQD